MGPPRIAAPAPPGGQAMRARDMDEKQDDGNGIPGTTLSLADRLDPAEAGLLHDGLRAYNERFAGPYDRRDLMVTARDAGGTLIGGLTGLTNWEWLYVDYLWIRDDHRRGGLGSRLLKAAEAEAVRRGCRWSRLYTYDFQAPGFYPRQGYEVWAELDGYPPGHRQIWFRKSLAA